VICRVGVSLRPEPRTRERVKEISPETIEARAPYPPFQAIWIAIVLGVVLILERWAWLGAGL
jgi:hypothetical protein